MAGMLEQLLSLAAAGVMMISTSLNAAAPQNDIDGTLFLQNRQWRVGSAYIPAVRVTEMQGKVRELRDDAAAALEKMAADCKEATGEILVSVSGYRSYQRQQEVYAESEPGKAQQPGASEHQTGLAFDVTVETNDGFESTPQYGWLMAHAHEYGFIQRYPANKADVTGISYEPWHYRYVGVDAATRMHNSGQTLEEFLGQ